MKQVALGVLAVVVLPLLAGCLSTNRSQTRDLPDCSERSCESELAAYAKALEQLPQVEEITELKYIANQITDGPHPSGALVLADGESASACADLEATVGRLLWESAVSPVDYVNFRCFLPGAAENDYEFAAFTLDDRDGSLTQAWGPRGGEGG